MAQMGSSIINGSLSVTGRVNLADYLYGNVCGNLCGTATNATCFGGCTFTQACTTIRSGLTSCTGTVTQVKIGDTAYNPTSGVISLPEYPSGSTVNNNKITIQKNSTAVGSFTLNQSSDCSINISVPTKVSELTNDSGFTTNTGTVTSVNVSVNGKSGTAVSSSGTISITNVCGYMDNLTSSNTSNYNLLMTASTTVGCKVAYTSSSCTITFKPSTGVLSMATLSATNVCGSSYVRTPVVMSNATSGVSANNNVTIRACCTNASCVLCCRNFIFCGSTGRMHGDVCGTVYGTICGNIHACKYSESSDVYNWMISCSCCGACNYLCSYGGGTWVSNSLISCNTCRCAYNCIFAYSCCGCANNTIRSWSCSNDSSSYNELCACGCNAGYNSISSWGCCSAYNIISSYGFCCYAKNYIRSYSYNSACNVIWSDSFKGNACNLLYSEGKCGAINEFTSKCFNCDADFKYYTICQTYNKINFYYYCNDVFHYLTSHYICYDGTTDLIPNCAIHAGSISSHTLTL